LKFRYPRCGHICVVTVLTVYGIETLQ